MKWAAHRFVLLAGIALFAAAGQGAQEPAKGGGESEAPPHRFRVAGYGDSFFEGLKYESEEGGVVELQFVPDRRSRWYPLPKTSGRLAFFSETTDERGRVVRVVEARVELIPGATESLFIFLYGGEDARASALSYRVLAMDESGAAFAPGDIRFLNLTGVLLKGQLGERVFDAPPGVSDTLDLSGETAGNGIRFRFAVETPAGWRVVHSTRTRPDRLYGALYVLKPPLEEGSYRLRVERLW